MHLENEFSQTDSDSDAGIKSNPTKKESSIANWTPKKRAWTPALPKQFKLLYYVCKCLL